MKEIPLSHGKVAIVDDDDFERFSTFTWFYHHTGYAVRNTSRKLGKQKQISLHREIMNALPGQSIDHKNRNTLDNRKINLRFATSSENCCNKIVQGDVFLGLKGIDYNPSRSKKNPWRAKIRKNGKCVYLGLFSNHIDAACAYNSAALKVHGEFACLNKI